MSSHSNPPALILAGGLGTRLRAVVADRQKVVADVGGRPFVYRLLDQLDAAGIGEATFCTGHLGENVAALIGDRYRGLRLRYSQEPSPLGTGGAVRLALEQIDAPAVLVMNGDSFCRTPIPELLSAHIGRSADATIVLAPQEETSRYGRVVVDADGRVEQFVEKGSVGGPGLINAGIYVLQRSVLQDEPVGVATSLERDVFPRLIGGRFYGFATPGPFIDIGLPESYRAAQEFFDA